MAESRTYGPTPRKLADARAEGKVARSPLLASGLTCLGLAVMGTALLQHSRGVLMAGFAAWGPEVARIGAGGTFDAPSLMPLLAPVLVPWWLLGAGVALVAAVVQVGVRWTPRALGARSRAVLAPGRALFEPQHWFGELAIAALAVLICFATLAAAVVDNAAGLVTLLERSPSSALDALGLLVRRLLVTLGVWLCLLAGLDWARRRSELLRSLRMTRSELDRERREQEADPQLRRRRGEQHRAQVGGPPL